MPCAVIAAAYLEHALAAMLRAFLINGGTFDSLTKGNNAALGTFAARTQLLYCLGLISDVCRGNLLLIGDIRNDFAHGIDGITFSSVSEKCMKLVLPAYPKIHFTQAPEKAEQYTPRDRFVCTCANTYVVLMIYATTLERQKPLKWDVY